MQQKFQLGQSYSYTYYEESLVSSNLNSKQVRFHGVRPRLRTTQECSPLSTISEVAHFPWGQLHSLLLEFLKPFFVNINPSGLNTIHLILEAGNSSPEL